MSARARIKRDEEGLLHDVATYGASKAVCQALSDMRVMSEDKLVQALSAWREENGSTWREMSESDFVEELFRLVR